MLIEDINNYLLNSNFIYYDLDIIKECINDNINIFETDTFEKLEYMLERFGEYVLFKDGTCINTSKYIRRHKQ